MFQAAAFLLNIANVLSVTKKETPLHSGSPFFISLVFAAFCFADLLTGFTSLLFYFVASCAHI